MAMKTILITIAVTLIIVVVGVISYEAFSYLRLKNECIKNNTSQNGYSVSINFSSDTNQTDIDKFADEIVIMPGIQNVSVKNKDEVLKDFEKEQGSSPGISNEVNQIGVNPFPPSITIHSNVSNIDTFLKIEDNVLAEAANSELNVLSHNDGNLTFIQAQLTKVNNASLIKDLRYIISGERNHFFEMNYSPICNPNFSKTLQSSGN